MDQPTAYFGGGRVIRGNVEVIGDLIQDPVRIGLNATTLPDTVGIGRNVDASGSDSTATGTGAIANNDRTSAYGKGSEATGRDATALGTETTAPSNWNTVIGYDAGSDFNGENVVLVGRKSEARGDDTVAIGEIATANGDRSTAVGRETRATENNASAFGQASEALGTSTTVVGQGVTVDTDNSTSVGVGVNVTGSGATVVGVNGEATADNATALGNGAVAEGAGAIAIGENTTVSLDSAIGFGDRDIALQNARSILYPTNAGSQTLVDLPVDNTVSQGVRQEFTFDIGGEPIFVIRAEADGNGGIQNAVGEIKGSFGLEGDTNQVDDVITGDISIQDPSGTEQIGLDATSTPVKIDLHNNRLLNFGIRSGEDITYPDDTGTETLVNFNVTSGPSAGTEMSYAFAVDDTAVAKIFSEANGSGGIQNPEFRLLENIDVNSNDIVDSGTTIWDTNNNYIPQGRLQNTSVTVAGNSVSLGGSTNVQLSDLSELTVPNDTSLGVGGSDDFTFTYDSSTDELVLADDTGIELIRQPKQGPTQFIQGADIGSVEAPTDTFSQVINASVTSALNSGDNVGYTFAIDNQSIVNVRAEADGGGGIQNKKAEVNGDLDVSGNITEGATL